MGQNDGINTVVQSFNFDIQGVSSLLLNLKETRWDPVQIIVSGRALPLVVPLSLSKDSTAHHLRYGDRIKVVSTDGVRTVPDIIPGDFLITMANFGIDSSNKTAATFLPAVNSDTISKIGFASNTAGLENIGVVADKSTNTHTVTPQFWDGSVLKDQDSDFTGTTYANTQGIGSKTPYHPQMGGDFSGTTGHYVETAEHADLAVGAGDFTFEGWVYPSTTMPNGTYYYRDKNDTGFNLGYNLDSTSQGLVVGRKTPASTAVSNYALTIGPSNPSTLVPDSGTGGTKSTYTENGVTYTTHTYDTGTSSGSFVADSLPTGTEIEFLIWGAGGAGASYGGWATSSSGNGGGGGYVSGKKTVTNNDSFVIVVGETTASNTYTAGNEGHGGGGRDAINNSDNRYGGAGGGYSGVFTSSISQSNALIIAGGGGGGGNRSSGGYDRTTVSGGGGGGGLTGQTGGFLAGYEFKAGTGGSQTAGGTSNSNANTAGSELLGGTVSQDSYGGGGGGGYWGGGGGTYSTAGPGSGMGPGGGGSSYTHSSITNVVHMQADMITPGNSTSALRGTAGNPGLSDGTQQTLHHDGEPGKVIIRYPLSSVPIWGDTVDVSIPATGMADAATVAYTITGLTSTDISGASLTGTATVANEVATFSFTLTGTGSSKTPTITATPTAGTIGTSFTIISGSTPTTAGNDLKADWKNNLGIAASSIYNGSEYRDKVSKLTAQAERVTAAAHSSYLDFSYPTVTSESPYAADYTNTLGTYSYLIDAAGPSFTLMAPSNEGIVPVVSSTPASEGPHDNWTASFWINVQSTQGYVGLMNVAPPNIASGNRLGIYWYNSRIYVDCNPGGNTYATYTLERYKWNFIKVIRRGPMSNHSGIANTTLDTSNKGKYWVYINGTVVIDGYSNTTALTAENWLGIGSLDHPSGNWNTNYRISSGYIYDFNLLNYVDYSKSTYVPTAPIAEGGSTAGTGHTNELASNSAAGTRMHVRPTRSYFSYASNEFIQDGDNTVAEVDLDTYKLRLSGHTPFGVTGPAQVDTTKNNMRTGSVYFRPNSSSLRLSYRYDSVWGTGWDNAWSIEWWMQLNDHTGTQIIWSWGYNEIRIDSNRYVEIDLTHDNSSTYFYSQNMSNTSNPQAKITEGRWYFCQLRHTILSGNIASFKYYQNGVLTHSNTTSAGAATRPSGGVEGFALGNRRTSQVPSTSGFQGHITEFRIRQTTGDTLTQLETPLTPIGIDSNTKVYLPFNTYALYDRTGQTRINRGMEGGGNEADNYAHSFPGVTPFITHVANSLGFKNNSSDDVIVSDGSWKTFGSNPFTIECFIYVTHTATITSQAVFGDTDNTGATSTCTILATIDDHGKFTLYFNTTGGLNTIVANICTEGSTDIYKRIRRAMWTHIVFVRDGNTFSLYFDGELVGQTTDTNAMVDTSNAFYIGNEGVSVAEPFCGYISNFRVIKGGAYYTAAFDPLSANLTTVSATTLLTCIAGNLKTDASTESNTITATGANTFADAGSDNTTYLSSGVAKPVTDPFGADASWHSDGADYRWMHIQIPMLGLRNYTLETWVWFAVWDDAYHYLFDDNHIRIYVEGTTGTSGTLKVVAANTTTGPVLSLGTWYHIAYSRSGTSGKLFVDGVDAGISISDTATHVTQYMTIGRQYADDDYPINGLLYEPAVSFETKYTASFTKPTLSNTAYTPVIVQPTGPDTAQYGDTLIYNHYYGPSIYSDGTTINWAITGLPAASIKGGATSGTAIFKNDVAQIIIDLEESGPSCQATLTTTLQDNSTHTKTTLIGEKQPVGVTNQTADFPTAAFWGDNISINYVDTALSAGTTVSYSASGLTDSQVSGTIPSQSARVSANGVATINIKTSSSESVADTLLVSITKPGGGSVTASTTIQPEFKLSSNHLLAKEKWHHIVASRRGQNAANAAVKIFVDGTMVASAYTENTFGTNSTRYRIGADNDGSLNYSGETLDFRITPGFAVYESTHNDINTTAFSSPTGRLSSSTYTTYSGGTANTKLLTFQRGIENHPVFADHSGLNLQLTSTGPKNKYNNKFKAPYYVAGQDYGSYYFGYGNNTGHLKIPYHADFNLSGSDWTFECWWNQDYLDNSQYPVIFSQISNTYNTADYFYPYSLGVDPSGSGKIRLFFNRQNAYPNDNGTSFTAFSHEFDTTVDFGGAFNGTRNYFNNQWHHLAWRFTHTGAGNANEGTLIMFINGTPSSPKTIRIQGDDAGGNQQDVIIGYQTAFTTNNTYTTLYNLYLADMRLVKGTALGTTTSYPVPAKPLTAISGTSLLLHFDTATVYDLGSESNLLLMRGATTILSTATGSWNGPVGGDESVVFDLSLEKYLKLPIPTKRIGNDYNSTQIRNLAYTNWTLEFNVRFASYTDQNTIFTIGWFDAAGTGISGTSAAPLDWRIWSGGTGGSAFRVYGDTNNSSFAYSSTPFGPAIDTNKWYKFKVSHSMAPVGSEYYKFYIDDTLYYTSSTWAGYHLYSPRIGQRTEFTFAGPNHDTGSTMFMSGIRLYNTVYDSATGIHTSDIDQSIGNTKLNNPAGHTFPSTMFDDSPNMAVAKISYPLSTIRVSNTTLSQYKAFKGVVVPIIVFSTENSLQAVVAADGSVHYEETTPISDATLEDNPRTPEEQVSNARIWY